MKPHAPGRSAGIAIAGCLLIASACHKKEEAEVEAPAPVQVTAVTQDTVRRIVAGDGALFAREQETVMPKISAPVQKFYANRGDHVKVGQLLATLENRDLKAAVAAHTRLTRGSRVVPNRPLDVTSPWPVGMTAAVPP